MCEQCNRSMRECESSRSRRCSLPAALALVWRIARLLSVCLFAAKVRQLHCSSRASASCSGMCSVFASTCGCSAVGSVRLCAASVRSVWTNCEPAAGSIFVSSIPLFAFGLAAQLAPTVRRLSVEKNEEEMAIS